MEENASDALDGGSGMSMSLLQSVGHSIVVSRTGTAGNAVCEVYKRRQRSNAAEIAAEQLDVPYYRRFDKRK